MAAVKKEAEARRRMLELGERALRKAAVIESVEVVADSTPRG